MRKPSFNPRRGLMFFVSAAIFLIVGIFMGVHMAATKDFLLTPVHAHVNLLGWVSSALMGLFFAQRRSVSSDRYVIVQFTVYTVGLVLMLIGLAGMLLGHKTFALGLIPGTPLTVIGVLLFAFAVVRAFRAAEPEEN